MDNRPIGVFDSGVGGLTVVNALVQSISSETIYYVGDTARVPYGNKSRERIQQYSEEIIDWLIKKDCKMVIVACNTASSLAIDYLQKKFLLGTASRKFILIFVTRASILDITFSPFINNKANKRHFFFVK